MFGTILIYISFALAIVSSIAYFFSINGRHNAVLKIGRYSFNLMVFGLVLIAIFLISNILAHNFQFTYIWQYSSKELSGFMLLSTFWAGQEGSFLLWALMVAIIGFFLLPYARRNGYEAQVMGLYALILVFLLLMLVAKNPFEFIWNSFPDDGLKNGFMPPNGRGLNPILENYWMSIHPPILFLGYASMSVPYVFALAGLIKKDYSNWINIAMPWTLFTTAMLGTGIMLGGFWAYETLGWGGFWGWDPVENSSLLPWLVAVALIHTMLVQKRTGGLIKTNFVLAIGSFLLILYATFLTRSGVLGETSVHSFVDPGYFAYVLLLIFQGMFLLLGIILIIVRMKDLSVSKINFNVSSKEFSLSVGSLLLLASTAIILIGTSWPLITEILNKPKVAIEISFYNLWNLPIIIAILLINALSVYLHWKGTPKSSFLKRFLVSAIAAVIPTVLIVISGVNGFGNILLGYSAFFSLIINAEHAIKMLFKRPSHSGSFLSHTGLALLMLGVLGSGPFSRSEVMSLKEGQTGKAFGYQFTFTGKEEIEKELKDREKFHYNIEIKSGDEITIAKPIVYWSNFNNRSNPFLEPAIKTSIFSDLYISPNSISSDIEHIPFLSMKKGDIKNLPVDSSQKYELIKYDMSKVMDSQSPDRMVLGAVFSITNGQENRIDTLFTSLDQTTGAFDPVWMPVEGTDYEAGFLQLIPNKESMALSESVYVFRKIGEEMPEPIEVFNMEISVKPFISLVWIGTIALVLGYFVSIFKYIKMKKYS